MHSEPPSLRFIQHARHDRTGGKCHDLKQCLCPPVSSLCPVPPPLCSTPGVRNPQGQAAHLEQGEKDNVGKEKKRQILHLLSTEHLSGLQCQASDTPRRITLHARDGHGTMRTPSSYNPQETCSDHSSRTSKTPKIHFPDCIPFKKHSSLTLAGLYNKHHFPPNDLS